LFSAAEREGRRKDKYRKKERKPPDIDRIKQNNPRVTIICIR
jgi:hypothetical protein